MAVDDAMPVETASAETNRQELSYEEEKQLGLRRADGSMNLTQLKPIHHRMLALYMAGFSQTDIARTLQKTDATISRWLHDPLVLLELDRFYKSQQLRLKAIAGKAVDAVDQALDADSLSDRLKGVDRYTKLRESLGDKDQGENTAEDVIERLLQQINIQVNIGDQNVKS